MESGAAQEYLSFAMKSNNDIKTLSLVLLIIILAVGAAWTVINSWCYALVKEQTRNHIIQLALPFQESIQGVIKERFALVEGLCSFAGAVPEKTIAAVFNDFAAGIYDGKKGIRNISIAPGGIQKYVYPLQDNEIVAGHNLLSDPRLEVQRDIQRALETGELIISGPYELRQGGQGLIARKAVFKNDRFWGLAVIVLDMPPIYQESSLDKAETIEIAMQDAEGRIFYGQEPAGKPVHLKMDISDEVWQMLVVPRAGWFNEHFKLMWPFSLMTLIIAVFTGGGAVLLTRQLFSLSQKAKWEQLQYKNLFNSIHDVILITDDQRHIVNANQPATRSMFGYELDELVGKETSVLYALNSDHERIGNWLSENFSERIKTVLEVTLKRKNGSVFPAEVGVPALLDDNGRIIGNIGIIRDITERKKAQAALHQEIEDKKILIQEIHHRVKNNLNIVASLLNLQKGEVRSTESARQSFVDMSNRIHSMSLIHDSLYNTGNVSRVIMSTYIRRLIGELGKSFAGGSSRITTSFDLEDIQLTITRAVPCGILINELITNAIKHAFTSRAEGKITVSLKRKTETDTIILTVRDNGVGLRYDFSLESSSSLGMRLVQLLTAQLDGTLSYSGDNGTAFTVEFTGD